MKKTLAVLLACFAFFLSNPSVASWQYDERIDGMTDEDTSIAAISQGRNDMIVVQCTGSDDYEVYVGVGEFIGDSGNSGQVIYRVDDRDPVSAGSWSLSTDSTAVFAPRNHKDRFLEALKSGSEILFQVEDYRGSQPRSLFSLNGSSDAIDQLNCL